MRRRCGWIALFLVVVLVPVCMAQVREPGPQRIAEPPPQREARLAWWREARFGMFIHWGLYAIPAGEWRGETKHAEWIRHTARIPIDEYDKLVPQFNPVKFNADEWVRMARDAGMRYLVITSKHHDGFCLWDSRYTDYDVMSTPFQRDILKELADACRRQGVRMCFYHSIMDWHHPDYLPRRDWERGSRSAEGAVFDRYVQHMKDQLRELVTRYDPAVLWFDGEWEETWTHAYGEPLYGYVRGLKPDILINNRVDKGRGGMAGMTSGDHAGDFGTPEQEIPATGMPGVDWETCMTMNDHWGYNKFDKNFKPAPTLIRMLADIASKGGNFLLNVGPTAEGEIPTESVERLREIGRWMRINSESIYGTQASPFKSLPWGRCTQKRLSGGDTRLYLHVFEWPRDGRLFVPGLLNEARTAHVLADSAKTLAAVTRDEDALVISVPTAAPDPADSVVVLDVAGPPDVAEPPTIVAQPDIFIDAADVPVRSEQHSVEIRYTLDGSEPTAASPVANGRIRVTQTCTVTARSFRGGRPVSGPSRAKLTKVAPRPAEQVANLSPGVRYEYFEGEWDKLPDFDTLTPVKTGVVDDFTFAPRNRPERFAFRYRGYVRVPRDGVYTFATVSDDGSRLYIGGQLVVDNDRLHAAAEAGGVIALAAGLHPITVTFFERTGGDLLEVHLAGPGLERRRLPADALSHPLEMLSHPPGAPPAAP